MTQRDVDYLRFLAELERRAGKLVRAEAIDDAANLCEKRMVWRDGEVTPRVELPALKP